MTTTHRMTGSAPIAFMKGAPETVLVRCQRIAEGDTVPDLGDEERALILDANASMAGDALRLLALAYRELDDATSGSDDELECEMVFLGLVGIMDPPRAEALGAVETCKRVGIRTAIAREAADMILTDDNYSTIVNAIKQGRWIYDNIKKYLA